MLNWPSVTRSCTVFLFKGSCKQSWRARWHRANSEDLLSGDWETLLEALCGAAAVMRRCECDWTVGGVEELRLNKQNRLHAELLLFLFTAKSALYREVSVSSGGGNVLSWQVTESSCYREVSFKNTQKKLERRDKYSGQQGPQHLSLGGYLGTFLGGILSNLTTGL